MVKTVKNIVPPKNVVNTTVTKKSASLTTLLGKKYFDIAIVVVLGIIIAIVIIMTNKSFKQGCSGSLEGGCNSSDKAEGATGGFLTSSQNITSSSNKLSG